MVFGFLVFLALEDILMNNIVLFVCGLAITLVSGMGVLVYMVHLGYEHEKETLKQRKIRESREKEKIDADLGVISPVVVDAKIPLASEII